MDPELSPLRKILCCATSMAMAMTMVVAVPIAEASAVDGPTTISTWADLEAFATAVNDEGESYNGQTITLANDLDLTGDPFVPIGTREHPFCGTFEGNGKEIGGLTITGTSELGLFGYVGAGGSIKDLTLGSDCSITATSSTDVVRNIGSIAGYVYGTIGTGEYAIKNCTSSATVTVSSTMAQDSTKEDKYAPDVATGTGYTDEGYTIEYVGGLVGFCAGSIEGCTFGKKGSVSINTHVVPNEATLGLARSVGGVVGQIGGYVVEHDTSSQKATFEPFYPDIDGTYAGFTDNAKAVVSQVDTCTNRGSITTVVDGDGGLDRFGTSVSAKLLSVGGIAGYTMTNISACENTGTIDAPTGDGTAGIVGCLRAVVYTGPTAAISDPGCYLPEGSSGTRLTGAELTITGCSNDAAVTGLHAVGGIAGCCGTYTRIELSANRGSDTDKTIDGTRWNKPTCGGIVGQTFGDVFCCYNRSDIITDTGAGYYVAGIVGAVARFLISESQELDSPLPEVSSCYSTGAETSGGKYKQGGICGESYGYIHDCYFITDTVNSNDAVAVNYGTEDEKTVIDTTATKMHTKAFVALVNAPVSVDEYAEGMSFLSPGDTDGSGAVDSGDLNDGYPVFSSERTLPGIALDESKLSAPTGSGAGVAAYTSVGNPIPVLTVSYGDTKLVQGADFYVIPDASALGEDGKCKDVSTVQGTTFHARIVGMGDYSSAVSGTSWTAPYSIGKGDFSTCTVIIAPKTFNYLAQYPSTPTDKADSDVVIQDVSGAEVPVASYTMAANPGTCINYKVTTDAANKSHIGYPIVFTANADSNYAGTATGYFMIRKAEIFDVEKSSFSGLSWSGQNWSWYKGNVTAGGGEEGYLYQEDASGNKVKEMTVVYTGDSIKPTITGALGYKDGNGTIRRLNYGTDYRIVYGDPGDAKDVPSEDSTSPNTNVTGTAVGTRACVTVRDIPGDTSNFENYQNFFFNIVQADIGNASECAVSVPSTMVCTGKNPTVTVKGSTGVVIPSSNYMVSCSSYKPGVVTVTITGQNNLKGTYTTTMTITAPKVGTVAKITKLTVGKRFAKLAWTKASSANGYKIYYRVKGTSRWKTTTSTTLSKTIKNLAKGKRYQFRVKAYWKTSVKTWFGTASPMRTSSKIL